MLSTSTEEVQKIKTKKTSIAIWNVTTLHQEGQFDLILNKLEKINIDIAGTSETHWCSDVDVAFQQNGYTIIHSGREDGIHRHGVALILSSKYATSLLSYEVISPRMMSVRVKTRTGARNIIQHHSSYPDEQYQDFQDLLQLKICAIQKAEELQVQGDFNAKVGNDQHSSRPEVVGKFGLGWVNVAVLCHI